MECSINLTSFECTEEVMPFEIFFMVYGRQYSCHEDISAIRIDDCWYSEKKKLWDALSLWSEKPF